MDAPVCKLCGKRHWQKDGCKAKDLTASSPKHPSQEHTETGTELSVDLREPIDKLAARVDILETLMDEILVSKRKRSEYMKAYMRRKRRGQ